MSDASEDCDANLSGTSSSAEQEKQQLAERFPRLRRPTVRWIIDVEAVALRCGHFDCRVSYPYPYGEWFDRYEYGGIAWPPHPTPSPNPA